MIEYAGYALITIGAALDLVAALALLRFPDVYSRLLGSTKCVTAGTTAILLGVFVLNGFSPAGVKALLCAAFVLLSSPVTAHAVTRAAQASGIAPAGGENRRHT